MGEGGGGGRGAESFKICFLWRSELFKPGMLFISVTNGAMNAPGHWELLASVCRGFSNCTKRMGKLSAAFETLGPPPPPHTAMNFIPSLAIHF
jgi:hypothetical protein